MAMAVKSSLAYSGLGIQSPECWSSPGWEHDSLTTDSWEWEDPNTNYATRQGHSSEWASVTVASSAGATKSGEFSPLYTLGTSATSVSSGIPGVARGSESASFVKHEPNENGVAGGSGPNESVFFRSLSRDSEDGSAEEAHGGLKSNGSTGSAGSADGENVGLKLGRRTYLEDSAAKAGSFALSPPGKKQRPLSPSTHVPRCQVEGCKADLSGCKDYHKRHKVCEMHSKAPKAIANGIEQRFCQQCSRFHILKEFDEGKRSCRRRLAGHNERRRKPHPETHSHFGLGNPFLHREISTSTMGGAPVYYPDMKPSGILHPHRGSLIDYGLHSYNQSLSRTNPWSLKSRNDTIPTFHIQDSKSPMTTLKPTPSLNLGGHHHFLEGSLGSLGQGLSLSSSTGGVLGNMEHQQQHQHQQQSHCAQSLSNVSGMIDSGRALSLLSSQSWALLRPPLTTTSAQQQAPPSGLSQAGDSTLEQLVASSKESNSRGVSRFSHHLACEGPSTSAQFGNKPFSMQSVDTGGLNFGLTATGTGIHDRGICNNSNNNSNNSNNSNNNINSNNSNNMLAALGGGYGETNSMLGLVQNGQDLAGFGSSHQAGATTMDLMQTVHSHDVHSQVYNSGFHSFDSSRFSDQQQLL